MHTAIAALGDCDDNAATDNGAGVGVVEVRWGHVTKVPIVLRSENHEHTVNNPK